ncbi:MAG: methyltransferase domain-containing protein [Pseudomonadota bacterium]
MATASETFHDWRVRAAQAAQVAFYSANYLAVRRIAGPQGRAGEPPNPSRFLPVDRARMAAAFRDVLEADRKNIVNGLYPAPRALSSAPRPVAAGRRSLDALRDARRVAKRKQAEANSEVFEDFREDATYPRYYLQNFHYQSDGWLSEASARRYDMQVETLFTGAAAAMRRQAIPMLTDALAGHDPRRLRILDLACGTGVLAETIKDVYPAAHLTMLDLSEPYLEEARRRLGPRRGLDFVQANAENVPADDDSFDAIVSVYLFHELPPKARRVVAREIARLMKPGGVFILLDSLQYGDDAGLDALLEAFPREFHEPYYDGYCQEDLAALFGEAGLTLTDERLAFLSKASAFRRAA